MARQFGGPFFLIILNPWGGYIERLTRVHIFKGDTCARYLPAAPHSFPIIAILFT